MNARTWLLVGLILFPVVADAAPDEGKARASESNKREDLDRLTTRNEILTSWMGGRAIDTFVVRLPAAEAALVGRWGARFFAYEPAPATVPGKSAGARFGEADADAADEEGEVEEGAGEEDAGEGFAARERKKSAPAPDPGVGGAAAPAGAKAAERSLGGSKNERNALRERLIRIVILYPKGAKLKPSPSPAAASKGK